jgi:hypothetical protein
MAYCQMKPACNCPKTVYAYTKADTVFSLTNGKRIALCGYRDTETIKGKLLFSEFVLSPCGQSHIIKFWGAVETCTLRVVKDTLFVEKLVSLPVGKNMSEQYTVWTVEPIYFVGNRVVHTFKISSHLPTYNPGQIRSVLQAYNHTLNRNTETVTQLAYRLLISAISGSKKAHLYLTTFRQKFTKLDGDYLEEYDEAMRMLKLWNTQHGKGS